MFYENENDKFKINQATIHYLNDKLENHKESIQLTKKILISTLNDIFILNEKLIFIDRINQKIIKFSLKTKKFSEINQIFTKNTKISKMNENVLKIKENENTRLFLEKEDTFKDFSVKKIFTSIHF